MSTHWEYGIDSNNGGSQNDQRRIDRRDQKTVPHIAAIAGDDFNWDRVAEMIEKQQIDEPSDDDPDDEKFEEMCVCLAYANYKGLDI